MLLFHWAPQQVYRIPSGQFWSGVCWKKNNTAEILSSFCQKQLLWNTWPKKIDEKIKEELTQFDQEMVEIDGMSMKAGNCFHFSTDPVHLLFNTNCPEALKERVINIVRKYHPGYMSAGQMAGHETKEYKLVAEALINGNPVHKIIDSISGTEAFSKSYLQDLVRQAYRDEYAEAEIKIQSVKLLPVNSNIKTW